MRRRSWVLVAALLATLALSGAAGSVTRDDVPASCRRHRVAESKVRTLIPMRVDAGGSRDVPISVAVPRP